MVLRLGTRGSLLARTQSMIVADLLERSAPGLRVEMRIISTSGDRVTDKPLHDIGGKGLFTKELEQALLNDEIDFAVHSFKDVPVTMPLVDQSDLVIAAVPTREDARDVLISRVGRRIADLPKGARIGTGSLRRRCQVLRQRSDLVVEPMRGNIDTRLRKLNEGAHDAIVLALAGLKRTELLDPTFMQPIDFDDILPAAGQGALALQCRAGDAVTRSLLEGVNDEAAAVCVRAEREVVSALEGDCHSPIAVLATIDAGAIEIRALVGARGGGWPVVDAHARADRNRPAEAVAAVYQTLLSAGAAELLRTDP